MRTAKAVSGDEQMRLLAEPHRLAVMRRLMVGPATISQVGRSMERHPAWVRHHVVRLLEAGLVELAEERTTAGYTEKYYRATAGALTINRLILPETGSEDVLTALGSHDFALELLARPAEGKEQTVLPVAVGSLDGLVALRQGVADIAGCHLLDAESHEYNTPYVRHLFPDRPVVIVTLADREQGLVVPSGNPKRIHAVADIVRPDVRLANRNAGSGTRIWLDAALRGLGVDRSEIAGYEDVYVTHAEAAQAVIDGSADVTLAVRAAADREGLSFVPLFSERYDLVIAADRFETPAVRELLDKLDSRAFRDGVRALAGYETGRTGREERIAV